MNTPTTIPDSLPEWMTITEVMETLHLREWLARLLLGVEDAEGWLIHRAAVCSFLNGELPARYEEVFGYTLPSAYRHFYLEPGSVLPGERADSPAKILLSVIRLNEAVDPGALALVLKNGGGIAVVSAPSGQLDEYPGEIIGQVDGYRPLK